MIDTPDMFSIDVSIKNETQQDLVQTESSKKSEVEAKTDELTEKKSETQKVTAIKYGNVISSLPVKVKGEGGLVGATTGAMIGGLLGTQVCGKELIAGAKCEEIAIVYATIGGAALGYVTEALLGNHDGFQYIIDVDDSNEFLHKKRQAISKAIKKQNGAG